MCANFPKVSSYGGRRSGGGNHGAGKAIDVMVSGSYGWEIASWARANAKGLGITEVIFGLPSAGPDVVLPLLDELATFATERRGR